MVEVAAAPRCPRCAAGKGCGAGLLDGESAPRHVNALLPGDLELHRGDRVWLDENGDGKQDAGEAGIANVEVTQVYKNDGKNTLEAVYVFPASTRAAVYAMTMRIGERTIGVFELCRMADEQLGDDERTIALADVSGRKSLRNTFVNDGWIEGLSGCRASFPFKLSTSTASTCLISAAVTGRSASPRSRA